MGASVLPRPDPLSRRGAAAVPRACASRVRVNPACVARPAAAAAASSEKPKPKQPRSRFGEGFPISPLPKRRRYGDAAAPVQRKGRAVDLPPTPGGSGPRSDRARPLTDPLVPFLQDDHTGGGCDEMEIDGLSDLESKLEGIALHDGAFSATEAEAVRRRGIERRRAEARREVELVVRTVYFNDPFIDPLDVLN